MNFLMPHSPAEDIKIKKDGILSGLNFVLKDMCKVKNLKTSCGNPDFYSKCEIAKNHAPFLYDLLNNHDDTVNWYEMEEVLNED